jgi:hypothetical protein
MGPSGVQDTRNASRNYNNMEDENQRERRCIKSDCGHVFIQRICFISIPHCLYCSITHVPTEPTRGHDLTQSINVSIQRKGGGELRQERIQSRDRLVIKRNTLPVNICPRKPKGTHRIPNWDHRRPSKMQGSARGAKTLDVCRKWAPNRDQIGE